MAKLGRARLAVLALSCLLPACAGNAPPPAPPPGLPLRTVGYEYQTGAHRLTHGEDFFRERFWGAGFDLDFETRHSPLPDKQFIIDNLTLYQELVTYARRSLDFSCEDYLIALNDVQVDEVQNLNYAGYTMPNVGSQGINLSFLFINRLEETNKAFVVDDAVHSTAVHELGHVFGIVGEAGDFVGQGHADGGCVMWDLTTDREGRLALTDIRRHPQPEWRYVDRFCDFCLGLLNRAWTMEQTVAQ